MKNIQRIRCSIMRGGTSKGIYLLENDLPQEKKLRDDLILRIFGSPDIRQIDGLGGADPLTSKVAIIGPSSVPDADVDYTFGQVSIDSPTIHYKGNCGNISAAVGLFAIQQGLVKAGKDKTIVRIYNTNTNKIIREELPMENGEPAVYGDCKVDGVPGTGAEFLLDYSGTVGAFSGKLLPTGNPADVLDIPDFGKLTVSLVDVGNPVAFILAEDLNLTGTETPQEVDTNPDLLRLLEQIRIAAGVKMGISELDNIGLPLLAFVAPPQEYEDYTTGKTITKEDVDFISRLMFMKIMHKTYAGTGSICTACAAKIPGTTVYRVTENADKKNLIRIGHPAGVIKVQVEAKYENNQITITKAAVARTARRIMDGYVYV